MTTDRPNGSKRSGKVQAMIDRLREYDRYCPRCGIKRFDSEMCPKCGYPGLRALDEDEEPIEEFHAGRTMPADGLSADWPEPVSGFWTPLPRPKRYEPIYRQTRPCPRCGKTQGCMHPRPDKA